jgi:arylsulfatase A-like enzyme
MIRNRLPGIRFVILSILIAGAVASLALNAAPASGSAQPRPNFLFIYTDDQRYDAASVVQHEQGDRARFPWFNTPNMDRLANEGVRFRNAFVVNSLCAPSRATFLTGRYSHFNGVASNFRPFPVTNTTYATLLRAAGYTTAYFGKWHMDSQRERPGFDHSFSYLAHGRYFDPVFLTNGKEMPTKGWVDDIATDHAIEFLRHQKESTNREPWLLILGFKSPHAPCEPPPRAINRFAGELARATPNFTNVAPYNAAVAAQRAKARRTLETDSREVHVNLNYFRCISAVDDCLGRLLQTLDELGFTTNTMVVYTSDNGFYLGEHGLGDKRSAYDESMRIPLFVRYPPLGKAGRARVLDEMILNLDVAQTFLDFAGVASVPAPETKMQGASWRPLLEAKPVPWRQSWFYEYFAERQNNARVPDVTAIRTTSAKLIRYMDHDDWTELFDLKADPYETKNLFNDPHSAELRKQLEAEYARLYKETGYRVPDYTDRPDWWGKPGGPDWKSQTSNGK